MMTIDNGGMAFPAGTDMCRKSGCSDVAFRKSGNQILCVKHYRFGSMRATAKRRGKAVPSWDALESMLPKDMSCKDCGKRMAWTSRESTVMVASLQHYRDGSMAIVCKSCNTRHHFAPGDSYVSTGPDKKYCPTCKEAKPLDDFYPNRTRPGSLQLMSQCKPCALATSLNWQRSNRDRYNAKAREYRAARKDSLSRADAMIAHERREREEQEKANATPAA